jgi:diguanylate cyclase (GGDEF)-like protein
MSAQLEGSSLEAQRLLANIPLSAVYQPIVEAASCRVAAHEGLIRGPANSTLNSPAALFNLAASQSARDQLEFRAAQAILKSYRPESKDTLLFVNFSARAVTLLGSERGRERVQEVLCASNTPARRLVIEITEHERVSDHAGLAAALNFFRSIGVSVALDDFGDGSSSLRLWAEIAPEYVKIDRYFCYGIHADGKKVQTVQAMLRLTESFGGRIIAEGIEDAPDLHVVRDLGVAFVQGYAIGRPDHAPLDRVSPAVQNVFATREIAIFPELRRINAHSPKAIEFLIPAPPVSANECNQRILELFQEHPQLHALAVVEDQHPIGLVNRRRFMEKFALPYYPELYGRKSCTAFMDATPLLIEVSQPIEELAHVLTSDDQRYLNDGFVLVDAGHYAGLGTAEKLVRSVTELRIEAARHANPLTFLPGNIPISKHIRRLLDKGVQFGACYLDLNNFKPYNDRFGYWRGDKMIRLLANVIVRESDPQKDFTGHVGGDDFVVLFQSSDWELRCERIVARFNEAALQLFDAETLQRGFIEAEDRLGNPARFPLTTLSIGAVRVRPHEFHLAEDVASAAAEAKHRAKRLSGGLYFHRTEPLHAPSAAGIAAVN